MRPNRRLHHVRWLAVILVLAGPGSLSVGQEAVSPEQVFEKAVNKDVAEGDLEAAIALYREVIARSPRDRLLSAQALLRMGQAYEKLGKAEAEAAYKRVVADYADQTEQAAKARERLVRLAGDDEQPNTGLVARKVRIEDAGYTVPYGAVSPDGRFLSVLETSLRLGLQDLESGETRRLPVPYSGYVVYSIFSPDGRMVAYNNGRELRVIHTDGSNDRSLSDPSENQLARVMDWSPDGSWLIALFGNRLRRVSFPDGDVDMIRSFDWRGTSKVSISPDGRYIAYDFAPDEERPDARDIFLMPTDWSSEAALVEGPADESKPVWTPDGRNIVFVSDRGGSNDLWAQSVRDGKPVGVPRLVKSESGNVTPVGFTDEGDFYYHLSKTTSEIHFARFDPEKHTLTRIEAPELGMPGTLRSQPTWSPDGRRLAYVLEKGDAPLESGRLVVREVESDVEREFTMDRLLYFSVSGWSPDDQRILLSGRRRTGGHETLWLDIRSGERETLLTAPEILRDVALSPDGKTLYFKTPEWPFPTVARDLATGNERTLIPPEGNRSMVGGIRPSPDGTKLAVGMVDERGRSLAVTDLVAGTTHKLDQHPVDADNFDWAAGGEYLLVTIEGNLWSVPMDGRAPQRVRLDLGGLQVGPKAQTARGGAMQFHPDGETLAFTNTGSANEVWVLEKFQAYLNNGEEP